MIYRIFESLSSPLLTQPPMSQNIQLTQQGRPTDRQNALQAAAADPRAAAVPVRTPRKQYLHAMGRDGRASGPRTTCPDTYF